MEEEVSFLDGKTRLYGIVGDPIEQVRSPEMITHVLQRRGLNALLLPLHVQQHDFDALMPRLLTLHNLDGLVFTIPFKARAMALAQHVGAQAQAVGALNALVRQGEGQWAGEMFDGLGCVEAFRRRGYALAGRRVMLIGLGGAGAAICAAVAAEQPASMRIFDLDPLRCERLAQVVGRISPTTRVDIAEPGVDGIDVLLNASPVGMLGDPRMPIDVDRFAPELIVFDAIVKPERTPLLTQAEASGCRIVTGREMMRGQIERMVDFFTARATA